MQATFVEASKTVVCPKIFERQHMKTKSVSMPGPYGQMVTHKEKFTKERKTPAVKCSN